MNIPFSFGKLVKDVDFTDRYEDTARLCNNFTGLINTSIIAPRRWGKSSLVKHALEMLPDKDNFIIVYIDAYISKDREQFLNNYANAVMSASTGKIEEMMDMISTYIPSIRPFVSLDLGGLTFNLEMELSLKKQKDSVDQIIELPHRIAEKKKKKVIVCIDEFQTITEYKDSLAFQRLLRSHWQTHSDVVYCLFGSKFNLMSKLVGKPNMPLYKFGDMMFLQKISTRDWIPFIVKRFNDTGKNISEQNAELIVSLVENHSYYVQQLAQLAWLHTFGKECTEAIIRQTYDTFIDQLSLLFMQTAGELTRSQLGFLRALCNGETNFTSAEVVTKYRFGTPANVKNIKAALEKKEITTTFPSGIEFQDPVFKSWFVQSELGR